MKRVGSRSLARLWLHGNIRLTKMCMYTGKRDRRLYHVVTSAVYALPYLLLFSYFSLQALSLMFSTTTPAKRFCSSAAAACLSILGGEKILNLKKKGA